MTWGSRYAGLARYRRSLAVGMAVAVGATGLWMTLSGRVWNWAEPPSAGQARAAIAAGRYEEARTCLEHWITARPRAAEAHYLSAMVAWREDRLGAVLPELERARKLGHSTSDIDRLRGLVLARAGRVEEAEPLLHAAWDEADGKRADPEVAEALARLAMGHFELGLAAEVLNRWAREVPGDPTPLLWRAQVDRRIGMDRATIMAHFQEALARDPNCDAARLGLAELSYAAGRNAESAAAYKTYSVRHPADPAGHLGMGLNARAMGNGALAAACFDRALALDPENTLALKERAAIDLSQGGAADALRRLDRAVAADPFDPELRYQRSLALAQLGRRDEAAADQGRSVQLRREHARMSQIQVGLVADPRDIPLRVEAARWMVEHGRAEEGIVWARMVLRDQPDNPDANRLLADYHEARGETGLANHYRLNAAPSIPSTHRTPAGPHAR
jgi:tetratricopeptide (TPR) repeat protein